MFVTLSVTLCVTWISSSHKSLFFYYVLIFFQIFAHLMSVNSVSFYLLLIDWKYIGFTLQYICIRNFFRFWIRLIFIQLSVTLSRIQEKFVVVIFCLLIWKKLAAKFCGKKGIWEVEREKIHDGRFCLFRLLSSSHLSCLSLTLQSSYSLIWITASLAIRVVDFYLFLLKFSLILNHFYCYLWVYRRDGRVVKVTDCYYVVLCTQEFKTHPCWRCKIYFKFLFICVCFHLCVELIEPLLW
jgi:hypothetical protein